MNLDQIKRAIVAKTKDKSNMPDWYYARLEKCIGCEFNSGNVEKLSFKDRIRVAHNLGKDACLKCTCGVEDKSSDPVESCPEGFWHEEKSKASDNLTLEVKSNKVSLNFDEESLKYVVDYGDIPYKFESSIELLVKDKGLENINITSSCGCTTANPKFIREGMVIVVKYDTMRLGSFTKNITIDYLKNNKQNRTIITIKGDVKNKL